MKKMKKLDSKLIKEWHPKKNGLLSPNIFSAGSNYNAWWLGKCGHEWQAPISGRNRGDGCPFCSGHRVLPGFNDLESQCPDMLIDWDYEKNDIFPSMLTKRSGRKVFWKCKNCGREWETSPHDKNPCSCTKQMK